MESLLGQLDSSPRVVYVYAQLLGCALAEPVMVHHGQANDVLAARHEVMLTAYRAKPERFIGGSPKRTILPSAVWINPPAHDGVAV
jgi:hypothetical protein